MAVNKNIISERKSPIVRVDVQDRGFFHRKVIAKVFETSLILFRKDTLSWYAFQCMDHLRDQLENKLPNKQKSAETMMEANPKSCILFVNKKQKQQKIVNDTVDSREFFRTLEMLIDRQFDKIPSVKFEDLCNDTMERDIPDTEDKTHRQDKPISIKTHKRKLAARRKVVQPRPGRQDVITQPLDEVGHLHFPVEESSHDHSAQVISGQLTRHERLESNSSSIYTRQGEYQPSIGDSRSVINNNHTVTKPKYPDYADYAKRKASFSGWRHRYPTPTELCNAGFFFTMEDDLVRCFQCGIGLKDFSPEDDPLLEHIRYSGQCTFLTGSLDPDTLERMKAQILPEHPHTHHGIENNDSQILSTNNLEYRHPELRQLNARIETFKNWPSTHGQRPSELAEAGLFYTGYDDLVRCFACDGGLRRWEPEDDPWIEHCRWFPTCRFAQEQKGEEFIAMVQAMVGDENQEGAASGGHLANAMHKLTLSSPQVKSVLDEHRATVVEMMGFDEQDFNDAVMELKMRDGTTAVEDIIELIEIIQERKRKENTDIIKEENPFELNKKLKGFLVCTRCKVNEADALFLPCAHHNTCMTCSKSLSECPSCKRPIKEKIKTYMG